ncbi:hypothetical protein [Sphingobacterium litopenaei]|uniref:Uncharacterized protein n=1 Tax=Sphingobacterium litopenaei TaxID=2763500 RepID=A0ABR7YB82_9SPHI|nr:hypothetical protein [Sphingobacterium litopenaei]MBD1428550.1 hypothetical protein [Sphingobacterium litopenaei]
MRKQLVQYILSVILLACFAYKMTSAVTQAISQEIEILDSFSTEKETKEIEKMNEIEVFIQSNFNFLFTSTSLKLDFYERKSSLPFRYFQMHYPPPNAKA